MPMLRRFSMGCTIPTFTVKPTKAEEDNICVVSTDYGYEPMLGLATPSSKPVKITQNRRRSSLNHVPMTTNSGSNHNKPPSSAIKQIQEALSSRTTTKTKRRSSMGTITSCPAATTTAAAGHARQAKRRSSMGTTSSAAALPPAVAAGPPETRRQRRLRRASLGDNTNNMNNSNPSLPITSHVHVVNLQASWQHVNDATRHNLAEVIVWRLLEADATLRRYKWRITSFSSPKLSQLTRLLVETLEVLVSHAGPDLDIEGFDEWRAQWTVAGLPGPAVARVLVESLQELAATTTTTTTSTTTTTTDEVQDKDKNDDEPAVTTTTMWNDPNVLDAWECTIVPVLKEWE